MPWNLIINIGLGLIKWFFERKAKRKLADTEFLAHIEAHQRNRQNVGKSAQDFDSAMEEARAKLKAEQEKENG